MMNAERVKIKVTNINTLSFFVVPPGKSQPAILFRTIMFLKMAVKNSPNERKPKPAIKYFILRSFTAGIYFYSAPRHIQLSFEVENG